MHLIQILLPLYDNSHKPLPQSLYAELTAELTEKFGGVTAYTRAPAEGHWEQSGKDVRDEIAIFEVMIDQLDEEMWHAFRNALAARFKQGEIIIRALPMQLL